VSWENAGAPRPHDIAAVDEQPTSGVLPVASREGSDGGLLNAYAVDFMRDDDMERWSIAAVSASVELPTKGVNMIASPPLAASATGVPISSNS
jgi:hypothetical protein